MREQFYRLVDDKRVPMRWYLRAPVTGSGEELDPRVFTQGRRVDCPLPLRIPLRSPGVALDFTLADFDMPVVATRFAQAIGVIAAHAVQRIPCVIDEGRQGFEIVNALEEVECLDEKASEVTYWQPGDGRPELVGRYRMVLGLTVDPGRASGHDFFRVKGWPIALIVSHKVQEALLNARGAVFERV